jgi:uroporphyrinogen-III synthase
MNDQGQGGRVAGELAGQRILITRPAGRADDLAAAIAGAGGVAVHVPMMTVEPLDAGRDAEHWQRAMQNLQQLATYRRVIAISVNAVHYGMRWLRDLQGPAAISKAGIEWYGIGAATAAEFARWGLDARGGGEGATSEALLALPDLQQVRGESILILRGVGGRETLAGVLRERGANVEYAECYRRGAPRLDAAQRLLLRRAGFAAVCVNSAETLRNFFDAANSSALRADAPAVTSALQVDAPAVTSTLRADAPAVTSALQVDHPAVFPALDTDVPAVTATLRTDGSASISEEYRTTALLVPSERVAREASELGFERVIVAANAGTEATLAALCALTRGVAR